MHLTSKAVATTTWATTVAVVANLIIQFRWWHPYCLPNAEGTGPSGYAIGLPLPYAQPTGVTSMAYFFMPHVYALDVVLIAGATSLLVLSSPILNSILHGRTGRIVAISGTVALALAIFSQSFVFSMDWFPVLSISTKT